jgi:4-amino-4-deoxychorismate lyase
MFQLVESIRIEHNELQLVDLHNARLNRSLLELFGVNSCVDIRELVQLPPNLDNERYKCRLTTANGTTFEHQIEPYIQRPIRTLQVVTCNDIDYRIKTNDRQKLDELFAQRNGCDDILIVKSGLITDSWAANILFFDGKHWETPEIPLLKGVQRENLLAQKIILERSIPIESLTRYQKIKLVNALIDFDRAPEIEIKHVNF